MVRAAPLVTSFGDDGGDPVWKPMCAYEVSQFLQEQQKTHCRISRVKLKGSEDWLVCMKPQTPKYFDRVRLTMLPEMLPEMLRNIPGGWMS